jgi:DNA-binding HxlR family transcriptional regulator
MLSERPDPTHGLRIIYELNDKGRSFAATLEVIMESSSTTVDRGFMGGLHPVPKTPS